MFLKFDFVSSGFLMKLLDVVKYSNFFILVVFFGLKDFKGEI